MPARNAKVDSALLTEHQSFVRGVARRLLSDEHAVDDVVQETWLAAIRNPPKAATALRAWLARVGRNAALDRLRGEQRRTRREKKAASPDQVPSSEEISAKLALHRKVIDAVESLDEPYRSTVLLRFYEEMAPRKIAAAQGVPVATVRSRLRRAFELLRGRLDRDHGGDRAAWAVALLPLAAAPPAVATGAGALVGGVLAMKKTLTIAAALVCIVATLLIGWQVNRASSSEEAARVETSVREAVPVPQPEKLEAAPVTDREKKSKASFGKLTRRKGKGVTTSAAGRTSPPTTPKPYRVVGPSENPESAGLRVIVTDPAGHPLPGLRVSTTISRKNVGMGGPEGKTDGSGQVTFPDLDPNELIAAGARHHDLWRSVRFRLTRGQLTELTIVMPDGVVLEGAVIHVEKGPIKQAFLSLNVYRGEYSDSIYAHSDERGRYRAQGVPPGTYGVSLQYKGIAFNERKQGDLKVVAPGPVVRNFRVGALSLHGHVFDASGRPVSGATVTVSQPNYASTTTRPDGSYRFIGLPAGKQSVTVRKDGFVTLFTYDTVLVEGEALRANFTLESAALVHLYFQDDGGRALPGKFNFDVKGENANYSTSVIADGKGHVRYHRLAAGSYRISISRSGWSSESQEVELGPAENTIRFTVKRTGEGPVPRPLHGTVRDAATGRPIEGVKIRAQWDSTYTDAKGEYSFDRYPPGSWSVHAGKDGYADLHLPAVEREKDKERKLDLELEAAETLIVRVLDWEGQPVTAKLYLSLHPKEGGKKASGNITPDADGRAVFRRVLRGRYGVGVYWPDHGIGIAVVVVGAGETFVEVRLVMRK